MIGLQQLVEGCHWDLQDWDALLEHFFCDKHAEGQNHFLPGEDQGRRLASIQQELKNDSTTGAGAAAAWNRQDLARYRFAHEGVVSVDDCASLGIYTSPEAECDIAPDKIAFCNTWDKHTCFNRDLS